MNPWAMTAIERKHGPARGQAAVSLRELKFAADDSEGMTFEGYGAVFGNVDSYGDVIQPGAFADTLAAARKTGQWPVMLLQHGGWGMGADDLMPVGIWTDMAEDGHGLKVTGKLADITRGREAYALMKMQPRSAITGLSIGYIAKEWSARSKPDEPRRTLKKVDLVEISLVTFPANPKARIASVKSGLTLRDAERALRDAGFSANESKAIVAKGYRSIGQRDAAPDDASSLVADLGRLINSLTT